MSLGQDFETTLIAAKHGAEWAWAALYRDLAGPVTGYLARGGAADPEDLTSETFLQVARNITSFHGDDRAFRSWVFTIAHRRLIDARRSATRQPRTTYLADEVADQEGGNVEDEAISHLAAKEILQAFERLSDNQRDVLALRIIADLTLEETAKVLGKRVGAVKALQRRGLLALRKIMELD